MNSIYSFLRLIRYPNIVFIILTQSFLYYFMIVPILRIAGMEPSMNQLNFWLLVTSTVLIAASGYIINDYFDVKIDAINKPNRIFIDRTIKRRTAMLLHWFFNGVAVILGFYVAWKVGSLKLGLINPIVAGLLWFYSTGYKKQPIIGNIIISFLTGLVVLIVVFYEHHLFSGLLTRNGYIAAYSIFIRAFLYFLFAFLVSMMREIVKDIQDLKGDEHFNLRTLPIVIGVGKSKLVVYTISVIVIVLTGYVQAPSFLSHDYVTVIYLMQTIQLPVAISIWMLFTAESQKEFGRVSTIIKVIMLMGILTIPYYYFLMAI